ncbi:MAG: hypothetical protein M1814_002832 [Vezdaea aestivalis]|nr:MAG: hypothetical protein M1814_002832 [Vezdaea aestivalis]
MPSAVMPPRGDQGSAIQQIVHASSDSEYLDQLIPAISDANKSHRVPKLMRALTQFAEDRENEIERMCNSNHQEFVTSVNQLLRVREGTVTLTAEILNLNQSIQSSTERLAEQKKALVDSRGVRLNIDEGSQALRDCLEVLRLANHVHELLGKKSHYSALRTLDELENVHLREITQFKLADLIQKSVPATQKLISEAVMADLNTWLYWVRETSQFLGAVAFDQTQLKRSRQKAHMEAISAPTGFRLNAAAELVSDEGEEFDVLDNEEVQVDFTPLYECLHIHNALGQTERFRAEYATTRRQQKELLLPSSIELAGGNDSSLSTLLEGIAGFAIVERATQTKIQYFRSAVDVEEMWESMCQTAILLISEALVKVDSPELLLKIERVIAHFMQTMEIVATDDYMPMPVNTVDEWDKVVNVSWYTPEKPREEMSFPTVLPFSQMYPLCCIDIRDFLNQFYYFSDEYFQHPDVIDETLKDSLDDLLCGKVCQALVDRLSAKYLGQIVQILINLEHFETACRELEQLLVAARSSTVNTAPIILDATEQFRSNKKAAEKRIFELVNSKIDDLVDSADYNWMSPVLRSEPSNFMHTLTSYLSNIMNSTLLGLPRDVKGLIYFDALSHAADMILSLPLSVEVKKINPNGVAALVKDVQYLTDFVDTLGNPILQQNLEELQQTVSLLQAESPDEYYDGAIRNRRYGRVDAANAKTLLEKYSFPYTLETLSVMIAKD